MLSSSQTHMRAGAVLPSRANYAPAWRKRAVTKLANRHANRKRPVACRPASLAAPTLSQSGPCGPGIPARLLSKAESSPFNTSRPKPHSTFSLIWSLMVPINQRYHERSRTPKRDFNSRPSQDFILVAATAPTPQIFQVPKTRTITILGDPSF